MNIDPENGRGQFCDTGSQYRSAIFTHSDAQKNLAEQSKQKLLESGKVNAVYTEIEPVSIFYPAEEYHQKYYQKNPLRYKYYYYRCGRGQRLKELWGE